MYRRIMMLFTLVSVFSMNNACAEANDYYGVLTTTEQQSIYYIISTLGSKSTISLLWHKSNLEKAGQQVKDIHPLRFWKEVLTNPQMRVYAKKISGIPKRQLVEDFARSFRKMANLGLIQKEYIIDFSTSTGVNEEVLLQLVSIGKWNLLVELFLSDKGE